VTAVGFGSGSHKLWVTDTRHSVPYGPYYFNSSISRDIITDTTSPITWAIEVTNANNVTLCASDYVA
jgi:hypothetical protein